MKPDTKRKTVFGIHRCKLAAAVLVGIPLLVFTLLASAAILRALLVATPVSRFGDAFDKHDVTAMATDAMAWAQRLAGALTIKTVNYEPGMQEFGEIVRFHRYLEESFPLVHSSAFIGREIINHYSLLYTVHGSENDTVPYLLSTHLDVVPADPDTWTVPPFSGRIVDGTYIYGRGALDDKAAPMGILEALEYMLQQGDRPRRSFYLAIGHDEESGGDRGAQEIANTLRSRGVTQLEFILDEGLPIINGMIPGTDKNVASIGVTEKGSTSLQLSVLGSPGHSSVPPAESCIGILAAAVARLEQNPQPSYFATGPEKQTFTGVAPYCTFGYRLLYSNLWLFSGFMARHMSKSPISNSIVRTTIAITLFKGGVKENMIPPSASASIHLHIHPSQSVAQAVALVRSTIADPRVVITLRKGKVPREAHPVSPSGPGAKHFQMLAATIGQVFHDTVVVPAVVQGNTDARWYLDFSRNIYRMYPFVVRPEDFKMSHGNDERITVAQYTSVVNFYYRIIKNADTLLDIKG